ncbi:hypothetical protein FPV67DRAFT_1444106 [Lyophyllum atratum]|nr:hypothetical protein FPV67DRAFT_1444106 [Lyophyllum atratum]
MAQTTPNGSNSSLTVAQVLAALQQLGITVNSNGDAAGLPFTINTTANSASAGGEAAAAPADAPAADAAAEAAPADAASSGVREGPEYRSHFGSLGANAPTWAPVSHRANANANANAAPPSSPVAIRPPATRANRNDPPTGAYCPHVCPACQDKGIGHRAPASTSTSTSTSTTTTTSTSAIPVGVTASTLFTTTDTWYVVTVGRAVGVYQGWSTVQPLVTGVSGFAVKRCNSHEEAEEHWENALNLGLVQVK